MYYSVNIRRKEKFNGLLFTFLKCIFELKFNWFVSVINNIKIKRKIYSYFIFIKNIFSTFSLKKIKVCHEQALSS